MKNGETVEGGVAALESIFKEYMSDMLEGMDTYNELSEAKTMRGAKGDVGEDDDGDEDDDGEDDGEDDDAEDEEESKRPSKR